MAIEMGFANVFFYPYMDKKTVVGLARYPSIQK